ncbi:TPA: hypothetical protein ACOEPF_001394 [Stenotrophomonas maltophilia]|uniref:hypothetical protein n=1 Tax=Stenotrophomonas TaxID=40323 RepID=UPI00244C1D03|nr:MULTISPECIES: hypothetical protein [Stenotrophomonas]MBN5024630.1 hypothetical protein [Stenotrophomonas maltophilia]MDH1485148.1 hypothetical protein [Stenotrophomonas sp. GD03712]WON67940.1 hypothetical protein RWT08_17240 [Stenotrophomonas maltophilia]HDS1100904.1 hypothetical protein [Stenotrophomonas maltophilia]HDS1105167.1 hypothetical protein [Stenotrophomonas maltophilia]
MRTSTLARKYRTSFRLPHEAVAVVAVAVAVAVVVAGSVVEPAAVGLAAAE